MITSLVVAVISVAAFGILSMSLEEPHSKGHRRPTIGKSQLTCWNHKLTCFSLSDPDFIDPTVKPVEDLSEGKLPPYWVSEFGRSGHLADFERVMLDELERNFKETDKGKFSLPFSGQLLERANWKRLFNYTEQIVKGMKLIAL